MIANTLKVCTISIQDSTFAPLTSMFERCGLDVGQHFTLTQAIKQASTISGFQVMFIEFDSYKTELIRTFQSRLRNAGIRLLTVVYVPYGTDESEQLRARRINPDYQLVAPINFRKVAELAKQIKMDYFTSQLVEQIDGKQMARRAIKDNEDLATKHELNTALAAIQEPQFNKHFLSLCERHPISWQSIEHSRLYLQKNGALSFDVATKILKDYPMDPFANFTLAKHTESQIDKLRYLSRCVQTDDSNPIYWFEFVLQSFKREGLTSFRKLLSETIRRNFHLAFYEACVSAQAACGNVKLSDFEQAYWDSLPKLLINDVEKERLNTFAEAYYWARRLNRPVAHKQRVDRFERFNFNLRKDFENQCNSVKVALVQCNLQIGKLHLAHHLNKRIPHHSLTSEQRIFYKRNLQRGKKLREAWIADSGSSQGLTRNTSNRLRVKQL